MLFPPPFIAARDGAFEIVGVAMNEIVGSRKQLLYLAMLSEKLGDQVGSFNFDFRIPRRLSDIDLDGGVVIQRVLSDNPPVDRQDMLLHVSQGNTADQPADNQRIGDRVCNWKIVVVEKFGVAVG